MSTHHLRSGPAAANDRSSRLAATGWRWRESVVTTRKRRRVLEANASCRMYLATVFSDTVTPHARSSAVTRGEP